MGMVGYLNLLTGVGMVVVAAVPLAYWRLKKRSGWKLFALGALIWVVAILLKVILEVALTPALTSALKPVLPGAIFVAAISVYAGLRTGLLESGLTYLGIRWAGLSSMSFDDAVAVGVGFGGAEAAFFGVVSMLGVISLLIMGPAALDALPAVEKAAVLEQYTLAWMPIPVIERAFAMLCHVFATVLAVLAAKPGGLHWLGLSIIVKTALDAPIPYLTYYLAPVSLGGQLAIEAWVALVGLLSLAGLLRLAKSRSNDLYKDEKT